MPSCQAIYKSTHKLILSKYDAYVNKVLIIIEN